MKNFKKIFLIVGLFFTLQLFASSPDEGMWLPMFVERLNYVDMQKMGLKLTVEELYNINQSSLKDAIVNLDGGSCTAEVISPEGLILTNHHCGYDAIQSHSTVEHDYLTDGFWAMSRSEELANPGMTAAFLERMEDVTQIFLNALPKDFSEQERNDRIEELKDSLENSNSADGKFLVKVKSFFGGNEFYMFIYTVYKDVRLVGAPPSSIGKFGGDTDNWMWPRHTGDFSIFRIYTAPDGSPAEYAAENIPLKPKHFLPISLKGVKNDDFAMIWGYPGTTDRFLTSYGVELATELINPAIVKIRDKKLEIIRESMNESKEVKIKYASKYASTANYWKYYIGQTKGLKRLKIYEKKKELENEFTKWIASDSARRAQYGTTLLRLSGAYNQIRTYELASTYFNEAILEGPEIILMAYYSSSLYNALKWGDANAEEIQSEKDKFVKEHMNDFFKNFHLQTDKRLFIELVGMFRNDLPSEFHPALFLEIDKKYKGDLSRYADYLYSNTIFADKAKFDDFIAKPSFEKLANDAGFKVMLSFVRAYLSFNYIQEKIESNINKGNRQFIAGLRLMYPEKKYYPDANSTMRMTYGKVCDYYPADAVHYDYYTTIDGIIEKEDTANEEFYVPAKLIELYKKRDYGRYADENGKIRVAFITNNDITGGNSGSPVINAEGQLIGVAFDGNWEAMSGDIAYEPELQRTICVDIRYVLFIVDKFAGASHLINEMKILN